jgi:tRNA1Val (adenine37-N6)-methyltransferase
MANGYFAFRKFMVRHDRCAMKVGTDGVLLGAWSRVEDASRILDVGTGCGLIALMAAQRSNAEIDAVEIEEEASEQALENVAASPWNTRIHVYHDSFQHFAQGKGASYDVILSNPPYFSHSLKPSGYSRSLARHDEQLGLEALVFYAARLLRPGGSLSVIIPAGKQEELTALAHFNGLFPSRLVYVMPAPEKKATRCLAAFTTVSGMDCETGRLAINRSGSRAYSEAYRELTHAFYM